MAVGNLCKGCGGEGHCDGVGGHHFVGLLCKRCFVIGAWHISQLWTCACSTWVYALGAVMVGLSMDLVDRLDSSIE